MTGIEQSDAFDTMLSFILLFNQSKKDEKKISAHVTHLEKMANASHGVNVDKWVEWYMKAEEIEENREVISVAYQMYKNHLKMLDLIAFRKNKGGR